jgi:hypothetical protein
VSPRRSAAAAVGVSMPPPQVTDLRRPSIDVLMMPSGPAAPPTHVQTVELGDPLSPRSAAAGGGGAGSGSSSSGRLQPVGEAVALAPEPEVAAASVGSPQRPNPKQDRWAGGIVEGHGVYTGWMLKKGETGNSWKRRYFACSIADKTLSYYDKPGGARAAPPALPRASAMVLSCVHACVSARRRARGEAGDSGPLCMPRPARADAGKRAAIHL